ncbi:MAG: alkane 1-monooxygenase [Bacteriovoracaceae bacterium]|jgi:alkane 1-monooxygenase|nr:alkane 1-monooxygenase [Bacteriovoracaceae bacterium]
MKKILRLTPYLLVSLTWAGLVQGGVFSFTGLFLFFGIHPILDQVIKNNIYSNDGSSHEAFLEVLLLFFPIFQTIFLIHTFTLFLAETNLYQNLGQIFSIGVTCAGIGITVAHELIHRKDPLKKAAGIYILALQNYTWFRIEHIFGHHKHVSTPLDPATAKFNQSLYPFLLQSLFGGIVSAYKFEKNRLIRRNNKLLINRMFHYTIIAISYFSLAFLVFGLKGFLFVLGISTVGILITEIVNYLEHYGLERKLMENGYYEPVQEKHSWDSDFAVTNFSLFNLGKHSHHHAKAQDEFQHLINKKENPVLPMGYTGAILLSLVPPLWKQVMNPLVIARKN